MFGVFIIKNYSICLENPILKIKPKAMPFIIETISLIKIYKNTINRISDTDRPIALNILNISA